MTDALSDLTPPQIAKVIATFDQSADPFTVDQVSSAIGETRREICQLSDGANKAAFDALLAFALVPCALVPCADQSSPWGTYSGHSPPLSATPAKWFTDPTLVKLTPRR